MHPKHWTPWILLAGLGFTAIFAVGQQRRRVDDAALKNAAQNGDEWVAYGRTQQETRFSPLNQINTANVNRLGLAWSYEVGQGGGGQEDTPLFWNGTLYGITNWSIVFAVDARTGKERWRWDPEVNREKVAPKICCGIVNRGVAFYNGMIIAPVVDGRLEALDAETGRPVWEARVAYPQENYSITMAPRIAKGKVVIGVSGAEYPVRGFFAAFDAQTGHFAWRFYTVPGDPSKPFENPALKMAAQTWEGQWWKMGGGATIWDGMAYDPEADLLYVGTGNGGPWPEALRQSKGRDNLFVASILAVKPDTGELKWYFQPVPGDSWDYDSVQQLLLADLTIKGRPRKVLMQANKDGFYYVIDRLTGQFISGEPFARVTWAKGLNEATGRPIVNQEAHYGTAAISISPSAGGAHNWSPMSFNPATGLVYIPSNPNGSQTLAIDEKFEYHPDRKNLGINRAAAPAAGAGKTPPSPPAIGPEPVEGQRGVLMAWDPITQKERWRANGGGSIGGGTVTTAGNLVLQVVPDGRLMAYSADKGEKLLEVQTNLHGGMGPPITYMLDGKQYVTFLGGTGVITTAGPARETAGSPVLPKMLTFVLDGKAPLPADIPEVATLLGTGIKGFSDTQVNNPYGMAIGPDGALYFCDVDNQRIRRLDLTTKRVTTIAGDGQRGYRGDGGPATAASLSAPHELAFDSKGDLYFAERDNHVIRKVDMKTGIISTVAGTGKPGFSGDGGAATQAQLRQPHCLLFDRDGTLLICDLGNHRIRRLHPDTGMIETYAGTGEARPIPEGAPVKGTALNGPRTLALASNGDLYLALREGNAIYRIDRATQTLYHVAGTGENGFSGDGGPALEAKFGGSASGPAARLAGPKGLSLAPNDELYVADTESHAIRRIDLKTGTIRTVLGTGALGDGPDGDPLKSKLNRPHAVLFANGVLYVADSEANRILVLR
ncbi:MAG TPA: PQQ-dependent dehydrogenase, methanol/ethanol family [Bryobacteraceae bacterium]|jgi:quinohemoprotein ethanol dehydrogenase